MPKKNTGLRLPSETLQRVDSYLDQLRKEPGWGGATQADAMRVLIDKGLKVAAERSKTSVKKP